ncbi:MAG: UDP-N-acetylmuramate dehydrogenase [Gemmatimonadetes bacterium]|nr:UDP-N-acetylmuramate dehydrogenase [Gemmatimonadota bacterium]
MLKSDVDLAPYTYIRIGGRAEAFWEVRSRTDLESALEWRRQRGVAEWFVLGGGANLLVNDERSYALVIKLDRAFGAIREEPDRIVVEAGVYLSRLVRDGVAAGWGGIEQLAGIPGTIGGAVVMNAGIPAFETFDLVLEVRALDAEGREVCFRTEELRPGYRNGNIPPDVVVSEVILARRAGDRAAMATAARRLKDERREKQPLQHPSFGSTFRNPDPPAAHGVPEGHGSPAGQATPAGRERPRVGEQGAAGAWAAGTLIERAGLKGARRGDAQLSEKHANFVVNLGRASARDVLELMILARREVGRRFGVWLEPEVRMVGFRPADLEPLLERAA